MKGETQGGLITAEAPMLVGTEFGTWWTLSPYPLNECMSEGMKLGVQPRCDSKPHDILYIMLSLVDGAQHNSVLPVGEASVGSAPIKGKRDCACYHVLAGECLLGMCYL